MAEVPPIPAAIVPERWREIDTSIDTETPGLLSPDQFDRYVETVTELLTTAGLTVTALDSRDPGHLEVSAPHGRFTLELVIRDDRSAEWSVTGGDEVAEDTHALQLAALAVSLLDNGPADEPRDTATTVSAPSSDSSPAMSATGVSAD
ncbi:hypothetical protein [Halostreptopolyspora alba]|uniref:Uncharacterized protein n=1 Tax=Halostreptopolyspora alba TaxID=2487137 RepID=A0A3N0DYE4_9ACTN|nr:hypothetical protein EFW17_22635 [Nocardiopsaceae bacterium YIM 96095]